MYNFNTTSSFETRYERSNDTSNQGLRETPDVD